jgi:hypothetical protein
MVASCLPVPAFPAYSQITDRGWAGTKAPGRIVNVRSLAGTNSVIVTRIRNGEPLSLVGSWRSIDGWWWKALAWDKSYINWIKRNYVCTPDFPKQRDWD